MTKLIDAFRKFAKAPIKDASKTYSQQLDAFRKFANAPIKDASKTYSQQLEDELYLCFIIS